MGRRVRKVSEGEMRGIEGRGTSESVGGEVGKVEGEKFLK